MSNLLPLPADIVWPMAIALAWLTGELCARWIGLPRISIYGLTGFLLATTQTGFIPPADNSNMLLLANFAFGLILFEFGYHINLRWLRSNPWIGVTGLVESVSTFAIVYIIAQWYGTNVLNSLLLASLAMSTSPAGILCIINDQRSSGQVTERLLHLTAINCVLAVVLFKVILGISVLHNTGSLWTAMSGSLIFLFASIIIGSLFGILVPGLMRRLGNLERDGTIAFALAIILLVAITHVAKLSPILATLTFGLVTRHRRIVLSHTRRNFGVLGELLTVLMFVFVVSTLDWNLVLAGSGLAAILIVARILTKTLAVAIFSHVSGVSWRKGVLTGLALSPISVFVILVLEQARYLGITYVDELAALAAMTLIMEVLGPVITQRALILANESPHTREA